MARKEEKRRLIEGYAASGMTRRVRRQLFLWVGLTTTISPDRAGDLIVAEQRREYCAKHGIAVSTRDYWRETEAETEAGCGGPGPGRVGIHVDAGKWTAH